MVLLQIEGTHTEKLGAEATVAHDVGAAVGAPLTVVEQLVAVDLVEQVVDTGDVVVGQVRLTVVRDLVVEDHALGAVSLDEDTLTYLNASPAKPATDGHPAQKADAARWSGILDGSGPYQSLGGVAEWTGNGIPRQCLFAKQYRIDRAINGSKGNSLTHLVAQRFPALRWDERDAWGYCDTNDQPIVVLPMTRQIYWMDRTVDTAGGVVTVQGDNGSTKLTYYPTVKSGQFPGPVYPMTLVAKQREQMSWAAGRKNRNTGFGYEPADSDAQSGNVSEYLLRKVTGRLEWVTPLTLRNSPSQIFVAYSVTAADEVNDGSLNTLSIYVLGPDDPRRINIDNLEADAQNYVRNVDPGFLAGNNGGKLGEYTPVDGDHWRAFGELRGRVIYLLDISASRKIQPKLTNLGAAGPIRGPAEPALAERANHAVQPGLRQGAEPAHTQ